MESTHQKWDLADRSGPTELGSRPSVKKCVALRARDDRELARQLELMLEAIEVRGGKVLHVARREEPLRSREPGVRCRASVLYQVPLTSPLDEEQDLPRELSR